MIDPTPEYLAFHARRYHQPQFTFVPDGNNLLIGTSYGSQREYLASVPVTEVGQWLLENAERLMAKPKPAVQLPLPLAHPLDLDLDDLDL